MPTAIPPEIRNRTASAHIGGAVSTMIFAEVKALDHMMTKAIPIRADLMSKASSTKKGRPKRSDP